MIPLTRRFPTSTTPSPHHSSPHHHSSSSSSSFSSLKRLRPPKLILLSTFLFIPLFLTFSYFLTSLLPPSPLDLSLLSSQPLQWLSHFSRHPHTQRLACREMDVGAQSCVFTGLVCINTSYALRAGPPTVYIVDDSKRDRLQVRSDDWCKLRSQSSDPRYFSSRHWPIKSNTVVPQRSCLRAYYRTQHSLFPNTTSLKQRLKNVKWFPNLYIVDLDYVKNNHNNHLLKDILWLLDVRLWQISNDVRNTPLNQPAPPLFQPNPHIYLPQGKKDFLIQTAKDVNRLNYAMVLGRNLSKLYPKFSKEHLANPASPLHSRISTSLLSAYPDLNDQLVFHLDQRRDNDTEMVCTPRLSVGAKIGNGGHDRVCRYLRTRAWQLFGIKPPEMVKVGQLYYPRPPKRVIILNRHISRILSNARELRDALKQSLDGVGIEIELIDTSHIRTAEDNVKIFSRAGVLITPHGSHAMGQIWMPRHSALIEVMPVGYTDYAFNLLSDSCKLWYYELQSLMPPAKTEEYYNLTCGKKVPHMMTPCTQVKAAPVTVNVEQAVRTIRFALERIGYSVGPWMDFVTKG